MNGENERVPDDQTGQGATPPDEGQGQTEETPDLDGYSSLEELKEHHARLKRERDELDSLRGRQGYENSQLRMELARLEGQIEALSKHEQASQPGLGYTFEDIQKQLDNEEITQAEALRRYDALTKAEFDKTVNSRVSSIRDEVMSEIEVERRAKAFMDRNPDYETAWNKGELIPYMSDGASVETAYYRWKADSLAKEKAELESKMKSTSQNARNTGVQQGINIERQKQQAGKVLGNEQGSFAHGQSPNDFQPMSPQDRNVKAREYLAALRAGKVPGR